MNNRKKGKTLTRNTTRDNMRFTACGDVYVEPVATRRWHSQMITVGVGR
jgi:hypothetical protein